MGWKFVYLNLLNIKNVNLKPDFISIFMQMTGIDSEGFWVYPFKPVRVDESIFDKIDNSKYLLEPKLDGFRVIIIANGSVKLWTREKKPIEIPDNLVSQLQALNLKKGTVLDGEIWTPTKRGSWRHNKGVQCLISLWDVIRDGEDSSGRLPIEKRREILSRVIGPGTEDISVVDQFPMNKERFEIIKKSAVEHRSVTGTRSGFVHGVVLKRLGSPRRDHATRSTEHPDWLKLVLPNMESGIIY